MVIKAHIAWLIGWLMVVSVCLLSLLPLSMPTAGVENGDKLGHFLAYAVMTFWFLHLSQKQWLVVCLFLVMGFVIEALQGLTTYRFFEWLDLLANTFGVVLAYGVFSVARIRLNFLLIK